MAVPCPTTSILLFTFLGTTLPPNKNFPVKDINQIKVSDYDLLILPGGVKSLEKLRQEQSALDFVSEWNKRGKVIGSICHGGQLLISSRIVDGRAVSGYYSIKDDLINAGGNFVDAESVVSDNLISCPHYKWMGQWMAKVMEIHRNNNEEAWSSSPNAI